MAHYAVEGKNVLLRVKNDANNFISFACATSITFNCDSELIGKTTPSSLDYNEYAYRSTDWSVSLSSVTHIKTATVMKTVFDVLRESIRKNEIEVEISFQDAHNNVVKITGSVLVQNIGITAGATGFSEDDIEFKGTGAFEIVTILADNTGDVDTIEFYGTEGQTTYTNAALAGKDILEFMRSGVGYEIVIGGAPNAAQVEWVASTTTFNFGSPLSANEWILILYE